MKKIVPIIVPILMCSMLTVELEARGGAGGGGGGHGQGGHGRGGGGGGGGAARHVNRSPMTGSKMNRPAHQRPQTRPATRPGGGGGGVQRPGGGGAGTQRPAVRPGGGGGGIQRPGGGGDNRPGGGGAGGGNNFRPGGGGDNRPGGGGDNRPGGGGNRPGGGGDNRPGGGGNRPGGGGNNRPGGGGGGNNILPGGGGNNRPGGGGGGTQWPGGGNNRPGGGGNVRPMPLPDRPNTRPGNVNYPRPGQRPNWNSGNNNNIIRPGGGNTIINNRPVINRPSVNIDNRHVNKGNWGNNWGSWGNWNRPGRPGGNVNIGNNVNVNVNNNFRKNVNWGYRPNYWGNRPWWNANNCHGWHHGSWNYGWNHGWYGHYNYYRPRPYPGYVVVDHDNDFAEGAAWGLAAWGLGSLIYNSGYQSYQNPYPAPPVQSGSTTVINYTEPLSVSAGKMPPGDEVAEKSAEEKSATALDESRAAFKSGDYLSAMKSVDQSLVAMPGDTAIHEYRALILFALGKYGEAAGVLNPVLASGPGWDWTTMTGLYPSQSVYTDQLRKLEDYSRSKPDDAASHFLLGYHYLVCAHLDQAYAEFDQTVKLQPADRIAAQLRDLCKSSISPDSGDTSEPAPAVENEAPPPVPADKLPGTWVSDRGAEGKVTLTLGQDGKFSWVFSKGDQKSDLTGTFTIDEKGLLVLASDDSQMVGEIKLPEDKKLNFVLAGGPEGDPGMTFDKAS